jgi:chromosome segregation ATPase
MTNSEAIKLLSQEKIPMILDGKSNESLVIAHIEAISALEENDKLKAEIEKLKGELKSEREFRANVRIELLDRKAEIEQLKEDYSLLARQYDDVENSSVRYYNEVKQLKSELEQSVKLPLTNADKIRSMSDGELSEYICGIIDIGKYKFINGITIPNYDENSIFEWLNSEVENGN